MTYPICIVGDQVKLREFTVDDVLAIIGDDRVTTWLSFDSRDRAQAVPIGRDRARSAGQREFYFWVSRRGDDK